MDKERFLEKSGFKKEVEKTPEVFLVVSKKFLVDVAAEILRHPNTETGGFILGMKDNSPGNSPYNHLRIAIATYTPPESEIDREGGHLNIGGPISSLYSMWQRISWEHLYANFPLYRDYPFDPGNPNTSFRLLGIWHKHPGSMIGYSYEDSSSIDQILGDQEDFLFPVFILRDTSRPNSPNGHIDPDILRISVNNRYVIDAKFYYREANTGKELHLIPIPMDSNVFPNLAPNPWYSESPERFEMEIRAFQKLGLKTKFKFLTPEEGGLPEIWLELLHQDLKNPVYLTTSRNFHGDRTFFLKFLDSSKTNWETVGMTLPEDGSQTMADIIEPVLLYQLKRREP